jgi:cytochrome c peroxidase
MRNICLIAVLSFFVIGTWGCSTRPSPAVTIEPAKLSAFQPLPEVAAPTDGSLSAEKIALGRMLFHETRLSKSQTISCNSCHGLAQYGVDHRPTSDGHKGQKGDRNSPTVYNAAAHFLQFWDGRALNVEEQAKGPVLNPVEMAMASEKAVVAVLKSIPEYVEAFQKAFPDEKDPVTYDNLGKAIGAFERKLMTPARWDRFLKGDQNALTPAEKAGFNEFASAGCQGCHSGALLGGNMFQKVGVAKAWPDNSDPGRYKVTRNEADRAIFKVPSLRNVEKTAPYFHDGKTAALNEAIARMAEFQVGKNLTDQQIGSILTWMGSLTGELPAEYIQEPALPRSTSKTPKPGSMD